MVPNYESAMSKMYGFELHQRVSRFRHGPAGPVQASSKARSPRCPVYGRIPSCYLRSFGFSLEQGTSEIDRDVIAQRGLGLPRLR